jgi:hypothetical protein
MIASPRVRALQIAQTVVAGCLVVGVALFSSPNLLAQTLSGMNGTVSDQNRLGDSQSLRPVDQFTIQMG